MTKSIGDPNPSSNMPIPEDPAQKRHQEAIEIALASGLTPEQAEKLVNRIELGASEKFDHNDIWLRFKFILTVYREWFPALMAGLDDDEHTFVFPAIARKVMDLANEQARYLDYEDSKLAREYLRFDREVAKEQARRRVDGY